ncbi:MAG TPA: alpha/beta fold hydrolase [Thermomicrobiales bacterium]|nr:alpha/beta fold hydrolase [Thermomicrobiales bacterium]
MTPSHEVTTGYADVNGARLYYEVAGAGHPLVLNHAGIADCRMWDEQFAAFAAHYRVVRYDMRGSGRSNDPPGPFSGRGDLYGLMTALGIARAHLVGLSMGGSLVLDMAIEHPDMVTALVPVAAGLGGHAGTGRDEQEEALEAAMAADDYARANEIDLQVWVDGPRRAPGQVDPTVRERVREMNAGIYAQLPNQGTLQRMDPPAAARLGEITAPTLVIAGDGDVPDILDIADVLAAGIAGARKVIIPGVAHMVNMERPAEFNRLVLDFLRGVDARRP